MDGYSEPFFNFENWLGLIIVSGMRIWMVWDLDKISAQHVIMNLDKEINFKLDKIFSVSISKDLDFHSFLKQMLQLAEDRYGEIFDYVIFLDYAYEKVDPDIAQETVVSCSSTGLI